MSGEKSQFQKMVERLCANREWLDQHIDELTAQYAPGDWIAILDGKVVAAGSDADEIKAALRKKSLYEVLILCVPDKTIPQPI